jgi:hypothetical protein
MKTYAYLWYLAECFLVREMFQTKVVEKIRTYVLYSITFFWKLCHLWDNMQKYARATGARDDSIIWHIFLVCYIPKATDTSWLYIILIYFSWQQWWCQFPQYYVVLHACVVQLINKGKISHLTFGLEIIPEDSSSCLLLCCCIHCELVA